MESCASVRRNRMDRMNRMNRMDHDMKILIGIIMWKEMQ